jgi:WD40 repeat protein
MNVGTTPEFFVTGGTLPRYALSYVERSADRDLLENLMAGEFCYVLTSRQMGKSSLMVRTMARLRAQGCSVASLDLSSLGRNLTAAQWYEGMISRLGRQLGIEDEIESFWGSQDHLSPLLRWAEAIERFVLHAIRDPVVIFIDEIDVVRSLPFSTDEFFAWIRSCYNRRADQPQFRRLSFCLLGVASPSDLIPDPRLTPFNIGHRIQLEDFTEEEASTLSAGLGPTASSGMVLRRILYWTGGHPYMTQRLCRAVVEQPDTPSPVLVDQMCGRVFLTHRPWEQEEHLLFVRECMLKSGGDPSGLLHLYGQVLSGRRILDDEADNNVNLLRLAGIVRVDGGRLRVRNRIYARAFNKAWVAGNLPDAELRRQRDAFRRGVLRGVSVCAVLVILIGAIGALTYKARVEAERVQHLLHERYAADMNYAQQALEQHNVKRALELLSAHRSKAIHIFDYRYLWRLCHLDLFTLRGHNSYVYSVAFSPDGTRLATASADRTAKIWDVSTGQMVRNLPAQSHVLSVAYHPNGWLLAAGNEDGTIVLWDVRSGHTSRTLRTHGQGVLSIAFSRDGRWLAAGSGNRASIWNTATWKAGNELRGHRGHVNSLAFSPDGKTLATASSDGTVRLWDTSSGTADRILVAHIGAVQSVAFSPNGRQMATSGADNTVAIWDPISGNRLNTLDMGNQRAFSVCFSPDGRELATGGGNTSIQIWDLAAKRSRLTLNGHTGTVMSVAFSPDGTRLASGAWDDSAKIWDTATGQVDDVWLESAPHNFRLCAFSPDGSIIATVATDDRIATVATDVALWDAMTGRLKARLSATDHDTTAITFSADGKYLLAAGDDNILRTYSAVTGKELRDDQVSFPDSRALATSMDGKWLAAGIDGIGVEIWNREAGQLINRLPERQHFVNAIAFSPEGRRLAIGSHDKTAQTVQVSDITAATRSLLLKGYRATVLSIAFSPDSRVLATGSVDTSVRLWTLATGRQTLLLTGHDRRVLAAVFSRDGNTLKTISNDGKIRLWRAASTQEMETRERTGGSSAIPRHRDSTAFVPLLHFERFPGYSRFLPRGRDLVLLLEGASPRSK